MTTSITALVFSHAGLTPQQNTTLSTPTKNVVPELNPAEIAKQHSQKFYDQLLATPFSKIMADIREKNRQEEINTTYKFREVDLNCCILFFGIDHKRAFCPTEEEKEQLDLKSSTRILTKNSNNRNRNKRGWYRNRNKQK